MLRTVSNHIGFRPSVVVSPLRKGFHSGVRMQNKKDWEPGRYMRFGDERTRPAQDLLAAVPLTNPGRIVDLGCGPGNSTELLASRYPDSDLSAMDSSSNMLEQARKRLPNVHFFTADLRTYRPDQPVDLFYSNAVLHWLGEDERIAVIKALLEAQPSGGIFAMQVPDNLDEPSHKAMTETASDEQFRSLLDASKVVRDKIPDPTSLYNTFKPLCSRVDIWHTYYQHRLENHAAIADWFRSTGLRPFLDPLDDHQRDAFLLSYINRLKMHYPTLADGGVLLKFPRLFMVLQRA